MNAAFREVIAAGDDARRDLFLATAGRLGTAVQNVEKDFWVCWTLDALFNGLPAGVPRLLFKGGTSLSKSFGLIDRFSEDIDVLVDPSAENSRRWIGALSKLPDAAAAEAAQARHPLARIDDAAVLALPRSRGGLIRALQCAARVPAERRRRREPHVSVRPPAA